MDLTFYGKAINVCETARCTANSCVRSSQSTILENFESKVSFDVWDGVTYQQNLVNVEVYFEEFNYESITAYPAYTVGSVPIFWIHRNEQLQSRETARHAIPEIINK